MNIAYQTFCSLFALYGLMAYNLLITLCICHYATCNRALHLSMLPWMTMNASIRWSIADGVFEQLCYVIYVKMTSNIFCCDCNNAVSYGLVYLHNWMWKLDQRWDAMHLNFDDDFRLLSFANYTERLHICYDVVICITKWTPHLEAKWPSNYFELKLFIFNF